MSLASFQEAFSQALLSPSTDAEDLANLPHLIASPQTLKRFTVYRERAIKGLIGQLKQVHPTTFAMLGEALFARVAREFIFQFPPKDVDPAMFAEPFAGFIERYPFEKPILHLADVTTLDFGCYRSQQAIDAAPMNTRIFTDLSPQQLAARRIQLHPACFWMSSHYAIYDIWRQHHSSFSAPPLSLSTAQEVAIIRPKLEVEVHRIDVGMIKVLDALDAGKTLNDALLDGSKADPHFNAVAAIQFLIQNGLIISLY